MGKSQGPPKITDGTTIVGTTLSAVAKGKPAHLSVCGAKGEMLFSDTRSLCSIIPINLQVVNRETNASFN